MPKAEKVSQQMREKGKMSVIDFHSHILPGIDDGSSSVETSLEMLSMSRQQGVELIVATSHFYADKDSIESFLGRRQQAYESLMAEHQQNLPKIIPGAEVYYFDGISRTDKTMQLCIRGTNVLLLEMPFVTWTQSVLDEVGVLLRKRDCRVVIAHLERYQKIPGNKPWIDRLLQMPVIVQVNAEGLLDWRMRGSLVKMFKEGTARLLGSDCHNVSTRPPNLGEGREVLQKKLGSEILQQIDALGEELLQS